MGDKCRRAYEKKSDRCIKTGVVPGKWVRSFIVDKPVTEIHPPRIKGRDTNFGGGQDGREFFGGF